ncbi:hypothetical protein K443DRAFT_675784 [Laccaria amethystina LaAM-08-1]|uniref:Uncharacterized protein n=1 Tax=Laccaria amethystina LaAM-08-1 TaxID=1095629 RepID=A0A0C9XHX0_9AGAR|nr:hypothetical protein K443DRAFT_675784 [Laccaria amethystina LaAM-08-1]
MPERLWSNQCSSQRPSLTEKTIPSVTMPSAGQHCRRFRRGHCPDGESCRYLHINSSETPPSWSNPTEQGKRNSHSPRAQTSSRAQTKNLGESSFTQPVGMPQMFFVPYPVIWAIPIPAPVIIAQVPAPSHKNENFVGGAQQNSSRAATKPCFAWRAGSCRFGDRCRYVHEVPSPNQQAMDTTGRVSSEAALNTTRPYKPITPQALSKQEGIQKGHFCRRGHGSRNYRKAHGGKNVKVTLKRQDEDKARGEHGAQPAEWGTHHIRMDLQEAEPAREEVKRKGGEEVKRKAREKAEQQVSKEKEESQRKECEEVARRARKEREEAERKVGEEQEEAARRAHKEREEAAQKEREEAEQKAREEQEETERIEREEAARRAHKEREDAERKARQEREEAEQMEREEAARRVHKEREEAERKAREEREEAERKAREEAAQREREEAERNAREEQEEAERIEREEAARREREEAEQKAREEQEEAEWIAREEAAHREREEAERKARQEQEEAERIEREEAARRAHKERKKAERKARQEQEEAERKEREEAAQRGREEAERKAREEQEEAQRMEREEAARRAYKEQEDAERKEREEREEAERKEREEAAHREREEAERKAREERKEAERIEREEAAQRAQEERKKAERKAREECEDAARKKRAKQALREQVTRREQKKQLEARERRTQESRVTVQQVVLGSTLVTCGAGIDIRSVVASFDLCRILVKHLPTDAKADEVAGMFSQQGIIAEDFFLLEMKCTGAHAEATVLVKAEQGEVIAPGLDEVEFRDQRLQFQVSANAAWGSMVSSDNTLVINWPAPSMSMIATYGTLDLAKVMAKELDGQFCSGRKVRAFMKPWPENCNSLRPPPSITLMNLPPNVPSINVEIFSGTSLLQVNTQPTYDHREFVQFLRKHLEDLPGVIHRSFTTVPSKDEDLECSSVKVWFHTREAAKSAFDALDYVKLRHNYPTLRASFPRTLRTLEYVINIPRAQYHSQRRLWNSLLESRESEVADVHVHERRDGRVIVEVVGDDQKAVGALKVRAERLAGGERLDADYWHESFFSAAGLRFLQQVHATSGAFVRADRKIQALRIYADAERANEAKELIKEEVERLSFLEWDIPLKRQSVRFFINRGLAALKEVLGEDSVSLDLASTPCKLTIKGGDEARHHLSRLMNESLTTYSLDQDVVVDGNAVCPICYDTVSHPDSLGCGHIYCTVCLRHYLISATDRKKFPLVCMGNDATCNTPISIPLIKKFITEQRFNHLIEVAFLSYVDKHPQELKYCTTPDCNQIYQCNSTKTVLQCPACFSTICPSCHQESHEGMTCEERNIYSNPTEQERLTNEWASENGVKKCPTCSVMLEKTAGCNHISCICGAHICWTCMGVFTVTTIYDHMFAAHGGFFNNAPQLANQPERNNANAPQAVADNFIAARERGIRVQHIGRERQAAAEVETWRQGVIIDERGGVGMEVARGLRRAERARELSRRQEMERDIAARETLEHERNREGRSPGCIIM